MIHNQISLYDRKEKTLNWSTISLYYIIEPGTKNTTTTTDTEATTTAITITTTTTTTAATTIITATTATATKTTTINTTTAITTATTITTTATTESGTSSFNFLLNLSWFKNNQCLRIFFKTCKFWLKTQQQKKRLPLKNQRQLKVTWPLKNAQRPLLQ